MLRDRLFSATILTLPDVLKQFILDTDASGTAISIVLSQKIDDKKRLMALQACLKLKSDIALQGECC